MKKCATCGSVKMKSGGGSKLDPTTAVNNFKNAKPKKANGGSLKPVNPSANPGLSKLPTAVRNKMGYAKKGGAKK